MSLPDFLIIGAQKSGTTWLLNMLSQHPDIYVPLREVHYFNRDNKYVLGTDWYRKHFEDAHDNQVVGEKSPNYTFLQHDSLSVVPRRIKETLPNVKLIYILRNPIDRIESAINHHIAKQRMSPLIAEDKVFEQYEETYGFIVRGYYYQFLRAYYEYFPRERVKVYFYEEDVKHNKNEMLVDACKFIGVTSNHNFNHVENKYNLKSTQTLPRLLHQYYIQHPDNPRILKGISNRIAKAVSRVFLNDNFRYTLSDEKRHYFQELYYEENEKLFDLIGRRCESWLAT